MILEHNQMHQVNKCVITIFRLSQLSHQLLKDRVMSCGVVLPDTKGDLQQGTQARDEENAVNEVTLGQVVILEAQSLRKNERD